MEKELPYFPSLLLVSGTGRNSGKTTFVTSVCGEFQIDQKPVCVKISTHYHEQIGTICHLLTPFFRIYEELTVNSQKDTARMLDAGAQRSFFIEADDDNVMVAFLFLMDLLPENVPVICESGNLRRYLVPSLFVILHTLGTKPKLSALELFPLADKLLFNTPGQLLIPSGLVTFQDNSWRINS